MLIAIDGPAASGKGTIAKMIAEHFGLEYLDTGSLYRAVAYKVIESEVSPRDVKKIVYFSENLTNDEIQNPNIYNEDVGSMASIISALPEVRAALLDYQRGFSKNPKGAVLDGRDIGTIVCPEADYKFYITANLEIRADRRYKQLQKQGVSAIYQSVLDNLRQRDERDTNRSVAPLVQCEDAIYIDSSHMQISEVLEKALSFIKI